MKTLNATQTRHMGNFCCEINNGKQKGYPLFFTTEPEE
jgi:hypothetical protein